MKKLKMIQTLVSIEPKIVFYLAIIAVIFFFLNLNISAYIIIGFIIAILISYFILSLFYWKCPHCKQYLPTKDASKITICPTCQKQIFEQNK